MEQLVGKSNVGKRKTRDTVEKYLCGNLKCSKSAVEGEINSVMEELINILREEQPEDLRGGFW